MVLSSNIRHCFTLIAAFCLSGCLAATPPSGPQVDRYPVLGGSVVVEGPAGFCIDRSATRNGAGGAFVLLASCASVRRNDDAPRPVAPALISVTVTAPGPNDPPVFDQMSRLDAYFRSQVGRAALSQDGDSTDVQIADSGPRSDVFTLHARVAAKGRPEGTGADQWRAVFNVGDRLISAAVMETADRPVSNALGQSMLMELVARTRAASPVAPQ